MFSRLKTSISSNPLVHVLVAAFIGGALPVLVPYVQGNDISVTAAKVALYAGASAVLRVLILLFPAKS